MSAFFLTGLPLSIIIVVTGIYMWVMVAGSGFKKHKFEEERERDDDFKTDYTRIIQVYEFLVRFPLTSRSTNQLHDIVSGLSMYNDLEQRIETARIAAISYLICIAILTSTVVVTGGSTIVCVTTFIIIVAFRRDMVNKRLRKKRLSFWQELLKTITSLQQEYQRSKSLGTALSMCQTEKNTRYLVSNIEYIMKSSDPESSLTHFCTNNPFHICIRLAYLCYNTHLFSPKYIEREGTDSFIDGLDTLIFDLTAEIDLAQKEKKKFYVVEKLPLVGLVATFAGPWFMQKYFTGLRYYYNDGFGFLATVLTILTVVGAYILSTRLNDKDRSQEDVTHWELRRFEDSKVNEKWEDRAGDRVIHFQKLIDNSLSYLTPPIFMFRKSLYGLVFLTTSLIICFVYVQVERHSLETNYQTIPESVLSNLEQHYEDYNLVVKKVYSEEDFKSVEDVEYYFKSQGWNISDTELVMLSAQVLNNKQKLDSLRFSPLHLFISFFIMFIGYNLPEVILARRAKMVRQEAKSEVLLLQSVVCQLMYTPLKLKDYLIFFSSISRLYADTHLLSYVWQFNYPEYLKKEAYKMFDSNYYLLMEQLYTLHSSLKPEQIFRTTAAARKYLAAKFLESREETLAVNYSWLSAFLKASLLVPVVLQIVLPLATFVSEALQQYSSMMPQ